MPVLVNIHPDGRGITQHPPLAYRITGGRQTAFAAGGESVLSSVHAVFHLMHHIGRFVNHLHAAFLLLWLITRLSVIYRAAPNGSIFLIAHRDLLVRFVNGNNVAESALTVSNLILNALAQLHTCLPSCSSSSFSDSRFRL